MSREAHHAWLIHPGGSRRPEAVKAISAPFGRLQASKFSTVRYRKRNRRQPVDISPRPISFRDTGAAALLNLLNGRQSRRQIDIDELAVLHGLLPIDENVANGALAGDINEISERLPARHHRRMLKIDDDNIGAATGRKPPYILPQECARPSNGRRIEDIVLTSSTVSPIMRAA